MEKRSAQIATVCECIDHCFAFAVWCDDFANFVDPEDMTAGLDRPFEIVSDGARLQSFLALRKLDDFFGAIKPKPDDLAAASFGIDVPSTLGDVGSKFLAPTERENINKGVAHLTEQLNLDRDSEVDLQAILTRCLPVFLRLVSELRKLDVRKEADTQLSQTDALIKRLQRAHEMKQARPDGEPDAP